MSKIDILLAYPKTTRDSPVKLLPLSILFPGAMFEKQGLKVEYFDERFDSEEMLVDLVRKFQISYKDLPLAVYQFQNKFRMELRAKSGILRGREFIMKDLYSFHLDEKDLDKYYEKAREAYFKIFEKVGIREMTYYTFASGGSFSKYSHEFQTVAPAGEDTIYICRKCKLAINKEMKGEMEKCPECGGRDFQEEKAIEVGNIFKLKNKYTMPFNLKVADEKGEKKEILMGCYGIGLSRLIGTIVEIYHDGEGIIWPENVAPFAVHLLSLGQNEKAEKIYQELLNKKIEVLYDDREISAGEKFADADLIGLPLRLVISEKTLKEDSVEWKLRASEKMQLELNKFESLSKQWPETKNERMVFQIHGVRYWIHQNHLCSDVFLEIRQKIKKIFSQKSKKSQTKKIDLEIQDLYNKHPNQNQKKRENNHL